jgi:UDPglucose 6-dehydrogenase
MKLGLIGKGTVGSAVYRGLGELGHTMSFVDPAYPETRFEDILDTDCVFVCVPTDQAANGDCDTSIVESVVAQLDASGYTGLVAIKSSIVPGTAARLSAEHPALRICSVPEFLRARLAYEDFTTNHDLLIIGSTREEDYAIIREAHGHYPQQVVHASPTEAEIVKYFNNVNHAVQIIFANMAFDVSKSLGANYDVVYNAIIKRDCFNPAYLDCNENLRGFGGHCLPKDTSAWNNLMKQLGLHYTMIQAAIDDNKNLPK